MHHRFVAVALLLGVSLCSAMVMTGAAAEVVIVGDSTVQDWPLDGSKRGWGQQLPAFFAQPASVVNLAAGGRSSKTFRAEGRWDKALALHPAVILIQFGHNDAHGAGHPESTDARTEFHDNMQRYVTEAKAAGMIAILLTPPPHRSFGGGAIDPALAPYAAATRAVAKEQAVPCIDLFATGSDLLKGLGEDGSLPLYCSTEDRSHFSERGALAFARMVAVALSAEPKPGSLLRPRAEWPAAGSRDPLR
jgi:lysophospholipase L1-like esterase